MALKASICYQEQPRQARHGKYIEDGVEAQAFYRTTGILEVRDKRAARSGNCSRGSGGCGSPRNTDNNPRYIFGRRIVPGFSVQARQADVIVEPPLKQKVFQPLPLQPTSFRKLYNRGDFPIAIDFGFHGKRIAWKIEIEKLDYHHYLPLFFDGLSETVHPYEFFARQGCHDLLEHGGDRVLPVVPQLIIPIKRALNTRNSEVICHTLKVLQHMILACELVGEALVPYYRQILPVLNLYRIKNCNLGEGIEYAQMRRENLGDLITETLELMERYGGEDAFINIKYMVPTYESVVLN